MRDERSPKDFCGEVTCRQVGRDKEVETITGIMTAAKLFLLSCLVAVVGYFTYSELQVSTLGLVKKIHIPAKRSDVFQKLFDDPEFYAKIHPLWYVFSQSRGIFRYLSSTCAQWFSKATVQVRV